MWLLFCHKLWLTYLGVDCSENSVSAEASDDLYFVTNHGSHTSEWSGVRIVSVPRQEVAFICHKLWLTYLGVDYSENSFSAKASDDLYFVTNHGSHTS